MFTVTLMCKPGKLKVTPPLVQSLVDTWDGRNLVWLATNEAANFEIFKKPENLRLIWKEMQMLGIDLIVLPRHKSRKAILIADMDSTMIEQECINEMAAEAGFGLQVSKITELAMEGKLDFRQALKERVALLKGLPLSIVEQVYNTRISFTKGGSTLIATMKANGGYTALISGGFTNFTQLVAKKIGFDEHVANKLIHQNQNFTGELEPPIIDSKAKAKAMRDISSKLGLSPEEVLAVGDGANDVEMLQQAGMGVALHAKQAVQDQVNAKINHGDLTALLYLQGYKKSDFY